MPTVFREKGFRFFFFSREGAEPPHIHMERDDRYAKFWLEGPALAHNRGFRSHELAALGRLIVEHRVRIQEHWHEHFNR